MYLGDGHISPGPRDVYRLRIFLDSRYPGILQECRTAITECVPDNKVSSFGHGSGFAADRRETAVILCAYSKRWALLLPQHGPGKKHERPIILEEWQRDLVAASPERFLRGLIHSDGCRFINTGSYGWSNPRYSFSNLSDDIRSLFAWACGLLDLHTTRAPHTVYVSRKADVARMDEFIGPKA
jgi:hypothetical protein